MTTRENWEKELNNIIFPSKEDGGIEHVDMSYKKFMKFIQEGLDTAYQKGLDDSPILQDKYYKGENDKRWAEGVAEGERDESQRIIDSAKSGEYNTLVEFIKYLEQL